MTKLPHTQKNKVSLTGSIYKIILVSKWKIRHQCIIYKFPLTKTTDYKIPTSATTVPQR